MRMTTAMWLAAGQIGWGMDSAHGIKQICRV